MSPRPGQVLCSAAGALRPMVGGAGRTWRVLTSRSQAVILTATDRPRLAELLAVTVNGASGTPHSIRLPRSAVLPDIADGARAVSRVVGPAVEIDLGHQQLRIVRWWNSLVPLIDPAGTPLPPLPVGGLPPQRLTALHAAVAAHDVDQVIDSADGLVGLGPGSTPSGDDVLAGLLIGWHATGRSAAATHLLATLDTDGRLSDRTTALSADLLRHAGRGHACTQILDLVHALDRRSGSAAAAQLATAAVLDLGATSGADLLIGLLPVLAAAPPPTGRSMPPTMPHDGPPVTTTVRSR